MRGKKLTKIEWVGRVLEKRPSASAEDIVQILALDGVKITRDHVNNIKFRLRRKTGKKAKSKKQKLLPTAAEHHMATPPPVQKNPEIVDTVISFKNLVERIGGPVTAIELIGILYRKS